MKKQIFKKPFFVICILIFGASFLEAQCLTCNNGTNGNKGKVSMFKSNYPDPGYQYACVPNSKWKEYNLKGWFVCYDGSGLVLARKVPITKSSNNFKNNSDSSSVTKTARKCKCNLPDLGCGNNKNCLAICSAICFAVSGIKNNPPNNSTTISASPYRSEQVTFKIPEEMGQSLEISSGENVQQLAANSTSGFIWQKENNSKPQISSDFSSVQKISQAISISEKCNCNCSLPNYGLDKGS
jgi:hypothetical protein